MNVYVLGAGAEAAATHCNKAVLRSRLSGIWDPSVTQFHGEPNALFTPDECAALLVAGGTLGPTPENTQHALRYAAAMQWFSGLTAGMALGVDPDCGTESLKQHISTIDKFNLVTVRDIESARTLREAGTRAPICTCADLAYLLPAVRRVSGTRGKKPVLGIVTEWPNDHLAESVRHLEADFQIRYVSLPDFADIDVCLTSQAEGVILSVLHEIPFATMEPHDETTRRECKAMGYPDVSDVRSAWSERVVLQEILHEAKPRRLRLAARNIELLHAELDKRSSKTTAFENGQNTLVVWAAPDEYWAEAEGVLAGIGRGFDCLVPANCRVVPAGARKRMAIPAGTLMHWAMLPADLKEQIENRYDNTLVCHAYTNARAPQQLADIAARTSPRGWEFRLWTHFCESLP